MASSPPSRHPFIFLSLWTTLSSLEEENPPNHMRCRASPARQECFSGPVSPSSWSHTCDRIQTLIFIIFSVHLPDSSWRSLQHLLDPGLASHKQKDFQA
ncbi:hypothetical protein GDO81_023222 [Engystomops pustulosus]|uniref:Uncharacterized protein n=1 Tax=Engystomops pustulosus TaxID=76066 RepID=A0AAV6YW15_ENGPU|nr:hypothetical protein GDO81_023222 [Engystomops pustulosus]